MPIVHTVVENKSRYPRDIVWENAQDLEHVAFLHRDTNKSFALLHHEAHPGSERVYNTLVYRGTRRLHIFSITGFGFRRIVSDYNIHQVEYLPLLGVTSALNSQLLETGDPEYPTLLRDEIVMDVPRPIYWLRHWLSKSLARHARIQCRQDEPFRARRAELRLRGIHLPYRIYFESEYARLSSMFKQTLSGKPLGNDAGRAGARAA